MEIVTELVNNQLTLYIPVALAIVGVILVFTFGFKSAEQPPFDKLTDDRKLAGKKKKIKEKKILTNGHISSGESKTDKSPSKEHKRSPTKEIPEVQKQKDKKPENNNKLAEKNKKNEALKNKNVEEVKNKKNIKKSANEKPVDFDDGNWEMVPTKADKKKKQEQSPAKKEKKSKKGDKLVEIEKLVKDVVNKGLREKEKETKMDNVEKVEKVEKEPIINEELSNEEPLIIEEKKDKKKEKKIKKENNEKLVVKEPLPKIVDAKPQIVEKIDHEEIVIEKSESSPPVTIVKEGNVAFDELGDIWTEAKAAKKSKKKVRRDN